MTYTNTKNVMLAVRQTMLAKDIKIKDIATKLSKSQSAVSAMFAQSNISLDSLNDICQAIGCQLVIDIIPIENDPDRR